MLKVSADHGVVEVDARGDEKEVVCDLVMIVVSVHHAIEKKNPAAASVLRAMFEDGECFEKFKEAVQAQVKATDKNRKLAEKIIELRKEIENND